MWLTIEAVVAVICASVPALKTLFTATAKSISEKSRESSTSSGTTLAESPPAGMREMKSWSNDQV